MLDFLRRLLTRTEPGSTTGDPSVDAPLVGHDDVPDGISAEDAAQALIQVDGDPAPGRAAVDTAAPEAPRDVFRVPGGLGLPAIALVNLRDPRARVELWALASPVLTDDDVFALQRELRFPPGRTPVGWRVSQVVPLPRLQCLVVLRHDDDPRSALVAVLDLACGALREWGMCEPDPFEDGLGHVAALRVAPDAILVRWRSGRVRLGRWGDVAARDHIVLFTPRERDGLAVLTLALVDGNVRSWGMHGTTLWLQSIDGRRRPAPRVQAWSLDLARVL